MLLRFALFLPLLLPLARAAGPVEHSLGNGLVYVRVHQLPADLPAKSEGRVPACVLDLRFVGADEAAATAFAGWLKFRAAPRSPLFVLVNGGTSASLHRALRLHEPRAGVVVIGTGSSTPLPDLVVKTSPEEERKVYDAFENGTEITALIHDRPDKVRVDEASLAKERSVAPAEAGDTAATSKRLAPVVDVAVLRAVHLHRSLLALKKI